MLDDVDDAIRPEMATESDGPARAARGGLVTAPDDDRQRCMTMQCLARRRMLMQD